MEGERENQNEYFVFSLLLTNDDCKYAELLLKRLE